MNILVVDAGNTCIKWSTYAKGAWRERGSTLTAEPMLEAQWVDLDTPDSIIVSNVAGASIEQIIAGACQHWATRPRFVQSQKFQCGVNNAYSEAGRLGSDRWAALIAAHHLHPDRDLLIVQAGTAVTIDTLAAQGQFRGGMIVPGVRLMLDALAQNTDGLARQRGEILDFPSNTADAMMSGAANAIAGAVERSFRLLVERPLCLISGGDADILLPLLNIPAQKTDQLVLEGLLLMALENLKED